MATESITAVLLAAGFSRRMGMFKPLLPVGGQTMVERLLAVFLEAGVPDRRVVVGYCRDLLEPLIRGAGARVVVNEEYERGMFSSVQAALAGLEPRVRAAFLLPVDMPLISPMTITGLLERHHRTPEKILVPVFQGKRGHPVVIPAAHFPFIRRWRGDDGLRGALRELAEATELVMTADSEILRDVDTPEDYRRLKKRWAASAHRPSET